MEDNNSQLRETYLLLIDLQIQEYSHTDSDWPGKLRDKAYALLQVYTVSVGGLIVLVTKVLGNVITKGNLCIDFQNGSALLLLILTAILLFRAFYFLKDAIHIKEREVFDSAGLKKLLESRTMDYILLCGLLYDKLEELKQASARKNT